MRQTQPWRPCVEEGVPQGSESAAVEQLGSLVRDAVRAVPAGDGAELWALAFQTLLGLSLPLEGLCSELEAALAGQPKGPLQVGGRRHISQAPALCVCSYAVS